ncbi:putative deoxyribonuclease RhsA [Candidatus Nitrosocosmicus oleophilus]|uniref:Putative deoxyribonuclease RhsA n=1 Tax=Candidatus Nitrosocosmicus oleophilus TaxID=1353260 RepID=A0A654LWE6_9ARCH|nr:hypothetical protein [Candidatus Nitrosocosmicus oleophilus]ALI34756.1 putative deoxyribonuclease RhsA [Candidatus Nitrosocosmicus oleophilus]
MVAIVAGNGLGLLNTSLNTIGTPGVLGQSSVGGGSIQANVNAVNGNLVLQSHDIQLAGRGMNLLALHTYNSLGTPSAGNEDVWRWNYEKTLRFQGPGSPLHPEPEATILLINGDGHETTYSWNSIHNVFLTTDDRGAHDQLTYDDTMTEWVWTDGSLRTTERYSNSNGPDMIGRLVRQTDISNNSINITYDSNGLLTFIEDAISRQAIKLTYNSFSGHTRLQHLEAIPLTEDSSGNPSTTLSDPLRLVDYNYDNLGRLSTVTRYLTPNSGSIPVGDGFVTSYVYDTTSNRIVSVTQSDGVGVIFNYDHLGRVSAVTDQGGLPSSQWTIAYEVPTNITTITDGDGQVWAYRHDGSNGRLTEVLTPPVVGSYMSKKFEYDDAGNIQSITDPQNNKTSFEYDSAGNNEFERDAAGNTIRRIFNPLNQLVNETRYLITEPDGNGSQQGINPITTRYVYDSNARLRFVVSPEGRVTENRYGGQHNGFGLLTQVLLYIGNTYDVTNLDSAHQLTEVNMKNWVMGLPDVTQVQLTEYKYDSRGNVSQQTSYATISSSGSGVLDEQTSVTEFKYDAYAQLKNTISVRGPSRNIRTSINSNTFDGIGRVLTNNSPHGSQTVTYDDVNRRVIVAYSSGLIETREYDIRGRLTEVSQTDGTSTRQRRYLYDNADRLKMLEDSQGGRRYRFYDAAGNLEFKVDATGAVTRFEYNMTGLLFRQTLYKNPANVTDWYDVTTDTVTKATLTVGGADSDVIVDTTNDRSTTMEYDEVGRITVYTDSLGVVTINSYDDLSRLVMIQTGNRVTRYLYDKDGRRVGIIDALGFLTEFKYDAGGRLIETVRYSQRSPAAEAAATINSMPVWIGATQQILVAGQPFSCRMAAYSAYGNRLIFSVIGNLPTWMNFDADKCTLRGNPPLAVTNESIALRVEDDRGGASDITLPFNFLPVPSSDEQTVDGGETGGGAGPEWITLSPLDLVANVPVNHVIPEAIGSMLIYRVLGGLPPGLSFDAITRSITGACSYEGFYSIRFQVINPNGKSTERTLSLRIHKQAMVTPNQSVGSNQVSAWLPVDTSGLRSYLYYDKQARVTGSVDEQQFLTETIYNDALNTQRTLRYMSPVVVTETDSLDSLKNRAGIPHLVSFVQYDNFGRILEVTGHDGSTLTHNEYDPVGRLIRVITARGTDEERAQRTFYNAYNEVTASLGGEGDAWLGANPTPERIEQAIREYGTSYAYDTLGQLVRSIDANGNLTIYYYDRENRQTHSVNVVGYEEDSSLAGEVSETFYNSFGQPEQVHRYAALLNNINMNQLLYRDSGSGEGGGLADQSLFDMLSLIANPSADQITRYEYDRRGQLVKQEDSEEGFTENIYNDFQELVARVQSTQKGQSTTSQFDYDLVGHLVSQTEDVGGINSNTRLEFDAFGRIIRSIDALGWVTTKFYPDNGRSVEIKDPLQHVMRTDFDAFGREYRLIDALRNETVYTYDETNRIVMVTTPEGRQITTSKTRHGETRSLTDGRGNVIYYEYNLDGKPTSIVDPLGQIISQTVYDKSGRKIAMIDARGTVTRFSYNQRNYVVKKQVDPEGMNLVTLFRFDAFGQQIEVTEANGTAIERFTTYSYDRKGRMRRVVLDASATDGLQLCFTNAYDDLDRLISVARGTVAIPNQHVILYEFDNLGRRLKEIFAPNSVFNAGPSGALNLVTHYRYDVAGHLTRLIDRNGNSTWRIYDATGHLTRSISALGEVVDSRYDAKGQMVYSHHYLDRLPSIALEGLGDVTIDSITNPAPMPGDKRTHIVYDGDNQLRFSLKSVDATTGWIVDENRYDIDYNIIEKRTYDRFTPEAIISALEEPSLSGIRVEEIKQMLRTLGYDDDDPISLVGLQRTFMTYDGNNRQHFTVDSFGSVNERLYDTSGNVVAILQFAIRPELLEYTEIAIESAVDRNNSDNRLTHYAYNAVNQLRFTINALGSIEETIYDSLGNIVMTRLWAKRPELLQYNESAISAALQGLPSKYDYIIRRVYDGANRLRFAITATGSVTENIYDALDNVVTTTRFARRASFTNDSLTEADVTAVLVSLRNDDENQVTHNVYDLEGRLRFVIDPLGNVTENVYDANGNLLTNTRFASSLHLSTLTQYDERTIAAAVNPLQSDPRNRPTHFVYNKVNQIRFTVDALGSITEHTFDGLGRTICIERFAQRTQLGEYSEEAISAEVIPYRNHSANRIEQHVHDALDNIRYNVLRLSVEGENPLYQVSRQDMNALGQLVHITSYASAVPLLAINEETIAGAVGTGDLQRDRVLYFVFDQGGRQVYQLQTVSPDGNRLMYKVGAKEFDSFGQVVKSTEYATTVALDAFDKATVDAIMRNAGDSTRDRVYHYAYNALGRAIYALQTLNENKHQVIKQDYDTFGRIIRMTRCVNAIGSLANFNYLTIEAAVNATTSTNDRKSHYVNDIEGRNRFVLEADKPGQWTVSENRYDSFDNVIESRKYDRYISEAWITANDTTPTRGILEQDVFDKLATLGYNDVAPASLTNVQRSHFVYDRLNRLRFTINALGCIAENSYDALGDKTTTVQFALPLTLAEYTESAIAIAVDHSNPLNRIQHFVYDTIGQLRFTINVIEPNVGSAGKHSIEERRYDSLGRMTECRLYAATVGHLSSYVEADLAASVLTVADRTKDRLSMLFYDSAGRQVFIVEELQARLSRVGGPVGKYHVTKKIHNALGQLVQRIDYALPIDLMQFDKSLIESALVLDPANDRTTTYIHDAAGRIRFEIMADLSFLERKYDGLDQMTEFAHFDFKLSDNTLRTESEMIILRGDHAIGDSGTRGHASEFDAAGRLTIAVDALGNTERYEYNGFGDNLRWIDKNGNKFVYAYDRKGRKTLEATPSLKFKLRGEESNTDSPNRIIETRFQYDAFGNMIRKIEAANYVNNSVITEYSFDKIGRPTGTRYNGYYDIVTGSVEPEPDTTRFKPESSITYDSMGNMVHIGTRTDISAFQYMWKTYDCHGRVVHEINPLMKVTRYSYNLFGEQETVTRYSVTISPGTPQNGFYWTPGEIDPLLIRGYDENGNAMEDTLARTIRLSYDKLGRKVIVTHPTASFYSTHTPGNLGHSNYYRPNPDSVSGDLDAALTRYDYNTFGDVIKQRVRANNIVEWQDTSYTRDTMGRLIRCVDAAGYITITSYDPIGNLILQKELTGNEDGMNRITGFVYNALNQQIRTDRFGLRYTDANGVEHGVVYWDRDQGGGGGWINPDSDVATTVLSTTFDGYGKPLLVTDAGGNVTSFSYNALGHTVRIIEPTRIIAPLAANEEAAVDPFSDQISERLVTSIKIDLFGRTVWQEQSTLQDREDRRLIVNRYDAAGNLVSIKDAEGYVKHRSYDFAGRVVREAQTIRSQLGPLGINKHRIERRYVYDALGQLTDTLDVYQEGSEEMQSGKSVRYNAFGEIVEERYKWGPGNLDPASLNSARKARYDYDNAGHLVGKVAGDGYTIYSYNLLGQITREERRGNTIVTDGTYPKRITEYQYDVLGRTIMIRRPKFWADVAAGTETEYGYVTPYSDYTLDRWGNVLSTDEGGYEFVNGQPSLGFPFYRGYLYDDNNKVIYEHLGTQSFVSKSGITGNALISKRTFRDLLGNVVKEVDEAWDPQSEVLISSRTRHKEYNSVGQLIAEIDATTIKSEYAYNIYGERLGTRNAQGTVMFNRYDRNGNLLFYGVLRTTNANGDGEYNSHVGTGTVKRTYLKTFRYDQASRRFATRTFIDIGNAPWSYTWMDGRDLVVQQRDVMGRVTSCKFDPFGNKAEEIDTAGNQKRWIASTEDYIVGRIERILQPGSNGSFEYNDFGEVRYASVGNAITRYFYHDNGLIRQIVINPNTNFNNEETTYYSYDTHGQLVAESRQDNESTHINLISYDIQRRMSKVEGYSIQEGPRCDLRYAYDEWGNVRRIQAKFLYTGNDEPESSESYYDYDSEGRMLVSNGVLSDEGTIQLKERVSNSVRILYDNVGRRSEVERYFGRGFSPGLPPLSKWDIMGDQRYTYDDLGHLRLIEMRTRHTNVVIINENGQIPPTDQSGSGHWHTQSTRDVNLRGDVKRIQQWARNWISPNSMEVDPAPILLGTTNTSYFDDGQIHSSKYDALDPVNSTSILNNYDRRTGLLNYYDFTATRFDHVGVNTRFVYTYNYENGTYVVKQIHDRTFNLKTIKEYDALGRLTKESVDQLYPDASMSEGGLQDSDFPFTYFRDDRLYDYNAEGKIILKNTDLILTNSQGRLPDEKKGQQTYFYIGNRMVGTIGIGRLANGTKFDFADTIIKRYATPYWPGGTIEIGRPAIGMNYDYSYTPISDVSVSGTSRHVVQKGESLFDIAEVNYGDGALWHLIAYANGIADVEDPFKPLPDNEFGRAYEIPAAVRNTQTYNTFNLFGMADIIGNDRPIVIPPPPPEEPSIWETIGAYTLSLAVQVGVTAILSGVNVPIPISFGIGAASGNLTRQLMGIRAPNQEGIDWESVGLAALEGTAFSAAGSYGALSREIWQQSKTGFSGWTSGPGLNWSGIAGSLFNVGFDAFDRALSSPKAGPFSFGLGGLINSAYNPRSGWAIPGSGWSPGAGAFMYLYGTFISGLGAATYVWIRRRLEQPSLAVNPKQTLPTNSKEVQSLQWNIQRSGSKPDDNDDNDPIQNYIVPPISDEEVLSLSEQNPILIHGTVPLSDEEVLSLSEQNPILIHGTVPLSDEDMLELSEQNPILIHGTVPLSDEDMLELSEQNPILIHGTVPYKLDLTGTGRRPHATKEWKEYVQLLREKKRIDSELTAYLKTKEGSAAAAEQARLHANIQVAKANLTRLLGENVELKKRIIVAKKNRREAISELSEAGWNEYLSEVQAEISAREAVPAIRTMGAVRVFQGVSEGIGAGLLAPVPPLAYAVGLKAADDASTGVTQIWTGEQERTLFSKGASAGAEALGASEEWAHSFGEDLDFTVSMGISATPYIPTRYMPRIRSLPRSPGVPPKVPPGGTGGSRTGGDKVQGWEQFRGKAAEIQRESLTRYGLNPENALGGSRQILGHARSVTGVAQSEAVRRVQLIERLEQVARQHAQNFDDVLLQGDTAVLSRFLSPAELNQALGRGGLARATRGKYVERASRMTFAQDPLIQPHIEPGGYLGLRDVVGKGPRHAFADFFGTHGGLLSGMFIDITTNPARAAHLLRLYLEKGLIVTY